MSIDTKTLILQRAYKLTRKSGLMGLTIGHLAKVVGMSKSGLFGHFNSKEKLQLMVLEYAAEKFTNEIIKPAIKKPKGIARLDQMMKNWLEYAGKESSGGCPVLSAIIEFDDHPGVIQKEVQLLQKNMLNTFSKAVKISIESEDLSKKCNPDDFIFKLYGLMISFHIYHRLLNEPSAKKTFLKSYQDLKELYQRI